MARHVPHLLVPPPWEGDRIEVDSGAAHHLAKVLRTRGALEVTYTDGAGHVGHGVYRAGAITRAGEHVVPRPERELTIAVAPPKDTSRARFLVEKLTELGTSRLVWIDTQFGEGRPLRPPKARAWMRAALEQSRGAHEMIIDGPVPVTAIDTFGTVVYGDQNGAAISEIELEGRMVLCIGPAGGFAPSEIPAGATLLKLSRQVLRTETAAIAGAALLRER